MSGKAFANFSQTGLEKIFLRLAGVEEESIVDGPGLRMTIFTQGCRHNCKGCHNPQTHPLGGGELRALSSLLEAFLENPLLKGMTFSGGEPFLQAAPLARLALAIHEAGGDIVCYTGYYYEDLRRMAMSGNKAVGALLSVVDLLVDGPYVEELRDLDLAFRGSSNQRLLAREDRDELDRLMRAACGHSIPGQAV